MFIRDERALETWLIKRAVESRVVVLPDGDRDQRRGARAAAREADRLPKYLQIVERRGPRASLVALLERDARDKALLRRPGARRGASPRR